MSMWLEVLLIECRADEYADVQQLQLCSLATLALHENSKITGHFSPDWIISTTGGWIFMIWYKQSWCSEDELWKTQKQPLTFPAAPPWGHVRYCMSPKLVDEVWNTFMLPSGWFLLTLMIFYSAIIRSTFEFVPPASVLLYFNFSLINKYNEHAKLKSNIHVPVVPFICLDCFETV